MLSLNIQHRELDRSSLTMIAGQPRIEQPLSRCFSSIIEERLPEGQALAELGIYVSERSRHASIGPLHVVRAQTVGGRRPRSHMSEKGRETR